MKLVTYVLSGPADASKQAATDPNGPKRAGLLHGALVLDLAVLGRWAARNGAALSEDDLPATVLDLLQMGPEGMAAARTALALAEQARPEDLRAEGGLAHVRDAIALRTPVSHPPALRDFYAFEQHVKAARARRGVGMIPEWYEIPVFYFSNTAALFGTDEPVPYPRLSNELDFELEMAAVIGRAGSDIPASEAPGYVAGYMVMNDWSARDLQR